MTRVWTVRLLMCSTLATLVGCGGDDNHKKDAAADGQTDLPSDTIPSDGGDARGGAGGAGGSMGGSIAGTGGGSGGSTAGTGGGGSGGSTAGTGGGGVAGSTAGTAGGGKGGSMAGTGGGGVGGSMGGSMAGTGGVVVPPTLTATIMDRRQVSVKLDWPAPAATGGGAVAGYDVRVAKVMITSTNFDDTAVTQAVTYTGTPAAPGQADGVLVTGLNIEQPYYFAVVGKTAGGTRGTIMATGTAVQAQFMTTVLAGAGTDGIGQDVDGSGDFGRAADLNFAVDGFSDLLVGSNGGGRAFVYFGSGSGYAATPSITITGSTANFGSSVVNAGDIDGDNLADIAVAAPNDGGGKVYVFSRKTPPSSWGTTNSWPATLTQAQANYVITIDTTFAGGAGSIPPGGLARLGNFDGTGADDLAVGVILHGGDIGSILIVKGSSTFASKTIPDAAQAIEIDGIPASFFGWPIVGIGQFFPTPAGPGLITSAFPSNVYAFKGQAPTAVLGLAAADDSALAPAADGYGLSLGLMGPLGGSPAAVTVGAYMAAAAYVDIHLGTAATGPFLGAAGAAPAPSVRLTDAASGNSFGILNLGGGVKGTNQTVSLVGGDALPDLVVAGNAETGTPVYIINGASIGSLTGTINVSAAQPAVVPPIIKVANRLPASWGGFAGASVIPHSNNDSYGDFAVGEFAAGKPGRIVVFY